MKKTIILLFCLLLFASCATQESVMDKTGIEPDSTMVVEVSGPLGSESNPVRCDMPAGERAYLNRLRSPSGKPPTYYRVGSFSVGPYGNILDGYEVSSGNKSAMVFMDMYHPGYIERNPVPGFTLKNK